MKIACLCPTYKRPKFLANAVQCFIMQQNRLRLRQTRLFVLDDATQLPTIENASYAILSLPERVPFSEGLPGKYRRLVEMADQWGADAYVIWEDDDVFLPWHLDQIEEAFDKGIRYYRTPTVWSNYGQPKGTAIREGAAGRFHSSWAFTKSIYQEIGGYPKTNQLNFDQQIGGLLREADPESKWSPAARTWMDLITPAYVYRWGNNIYHGSQAGDRGYENLWHMLDRLPYELVTEFIPQLDEETVQLFHNLWRRMD